MAILPSRAQSSLPPNVTPVFDPYKMAAIECRMDADALRKRLADGEALLDRLRRRVSERRASADPLAVARALCDSVLRECADVETAPVRGGSGGGGEEHKFPPVEVKLTTDAARRRALKKGTKALAALVAAEERKLARLRATLSLATALAKDPATLDAPESAAAWDDGMTLLLNEMPYPDDGGGTDASDAIARHVADARPLGLVNGQLIIVAGGGLSDENEFDEREREDVARRA